MPIFKPGLILLAAVFLAACLSDDTATRDAPTQVTVTDASVVVAGPAGFCIDTEASSMRSDQAFVLLGSCAAISNVPLMPQPDIPAMLSASVARGVSPPPETLERYFRTQDGAAKLTNASAVSLRSESNALFLKTTGSSGETWRGIVPVKPGVIVTLALQPIGTQAIPEKAQFNVLSAFADRITAANSNALLATKGK